MDNERAFYIDGRWIDRGAGSVHDVINPATEETIAAISMAGADDVDLAVAAARRAFPAWAATPVAERIACLQRLAAVYERRADDMAAAICVEMGAPVSLALSAQAASGLAHIRTFIDELATFPFEYTLSDRAPNDRIVREPIGVCGLITPWNWPMNQVCLKVPAALATGCTTILKPSENAPLSALLLANSSTRRVSHPVSSTS